MDKAIYFDMDGTIANLYAVEEWLPKLRAYDPSPYMDAKPMLHLSTLARMLHHLQANGYHIGIVSWLSKDPDPAYGEAVTEAKLRWLAKHLPSVEWDEIVIVPYGTPKASVVRFPDGALFDDEKPNREAWQGEAFDVAQILADLRSL
jgi:hypothetical protein